MNQIKLNHLNDSHIDGIMTINELSFAIPWSRNSIEDELKNKFAIYTVATLNDKVVGYGGLWLIIDEANITNIAVHPEYRKSGIASLILNELLNICAKQNAVSIDLEVRVSNVAAQKLYKKFDFNEIGIRKKYYEDNNEDAILMKKSSILD